jgi:hypothetical protein
MTTEEARQARQEAIDTLVQLTEFVKALTTGGHYEGGENDKFQM